jgi:hypothetical protein
MIVVLFLMYYFPFITCIHGRKNMILSEILSFMHTLLECGKITNTHTHIYIRTTTGLFQFFNKKKTEKQKKKRRCVDDVTARASERADGAGETTKRKAWPTSSGNREEKVCVYVAAIG